MRSALEDIFSRSHDCDICGEPIVGYLSNTVSLHYATRHQPKDGTPSPNVNCSCLIPKESSNRGEREHYQLFHMSGEYYRCKTCSKILPSAEMASHLIACQAAKSNGSYGSILCPHCGIECAHEQSLKSHIINVHEQCKCKYCGKKFWSIKLMKMHTKTEHEGVQREWPCRDCDKKFNMKNKLDR